MKKTIHPESESLRNPESAIRNPRSGNPRSLLMKKAGSLLARRAHSRADLQRKLAAYGDDGEVESVLGHLERLGLLNDSDYAYNFALRHIRQLGWSPAKVQDALLGHEVGPAIVQRALQQALIESGGEDSVIQKYLLKRYGKSGLPADPPSVRKLIMHLRQRGFEEENILSALGITETVLRRFETGEHID